MFFQNSPNNTNEKSSDCSLRCETVSLSSPLKQSTIRQNVTVQTLLQQINFLNTVIWRQNTAMPVVQILSFKNDTANSGYPKSYYVQIQSIEKQIKNLSGIQIRDALYLIQQCLLGIQALSYKYHHFDFHSLYFGLNQKGECKTWISQNFLTFEPNPLPLPRQQIIINYVLKMIYEISNNPTKCQLYQLVQQSARHINIGYNQVHQKIKQYAYKKNILIPNCIQFFKRQSMIFKTRSEIVKQSVDCQSNLPLKLKLNAKQNLNQSFISIQKNSEIGDGQFRHKQNRFTWHSQFIQNSPLLRPKKISMQQKSNCEVKVRIVQKNKSVQNMLKKSQRVKNKLKQSKDSFCNLLKQSSKLVYRSFIQQGKSQKTSTSITLPSQNMICSEAPSKINKSQIQVANTYQSVNFSQKYTIQVRKSSQQKSHLKQSLAFNLKTKMRQSVNFNNNSYNFGGLIPLPQKSIKQSQQIIQDHYFQMPSEPKLLLNLRKGKQKVLKSMVLSQNDLQIPTQNFGWDWQNKMSKLLTQDQGNLKYSVYCGEQKKAEPLQIKLEKLGKLGRQITSTVMHQQHQH